MNYPVAHFRFFLVVLTNLITCLVAFAENAHPKETQHVSVPKRSTYSARLGEPSAHLLGPITTDEASATQQVPTDKEAPAEPIIWPSDPKNQDIGVQEPQHHTIFSEAESEKSKYPNANVTGLLQMDGAFFHQSATNRATLGNIEDGLGFRRVRPGITGYVTEHISYMLELDFSNTIPLFVDMWVNFEKVPYLGNLRIGRWRQPFGMSELTSVRALPFMERELGFFIGPFRQTGIGFFDHSADERMTWGLSGYRFQSDNFGNVLGDNGGWGMAGRVTWLPIDNGDGDLIHLGFNYSLNDPAKNEIRFFSPPEVVVAESVGFNPAPVIATPDFVDTGIIPAHTINLVNLEFAAAVGKLVFQSEMRWAIVDQIGAPSRALPIAYAMVRYMLTDEIVPYDRKIGAFDRVKPRSPLGWGVVGLGAWELVGRWSYIDLNGTIGDGPGRELNNLTLGLNWYLNNRVRCTFNYIHSFLDDPILGRSNADTIAFRTQVDF